MNEYVEEKVKGPGIALLVVGILTLLANLVGLLFRLIGSIASIIDGISNGYGMEFWGPFLGSTGWQILLSIIGFFTSFVIIMAGSRLRSLRSPGLIYAGAILAALPCCSSWCCCVGLPIGVWVIVTMQDEQVKAAFTE